MEVPSSSCSTCQINKQPIYSVDWQLVFFKKWHKSWQVGYNPSMKPRAPDGQCEAEDRARRGATSGQCRTPGRRSHKSTLQLPWNGIVGKSTPSAGCALGLFAPGSARAVCWSQSHQCLQLPHLLFPASHSILGFLIAQSGTDLFPRGRRTLLSERDGFSFFLPPHPVLSPPCYPPSPIFPVSFL